MFAVAVLRDITDYVTYKRGNTDELAELHGESTNRNQNPEVEPTRHQFPVAKSNTQPKIHYGGGLANYRLIAAKIKQLNAFYTH